MALGFCYMSFVIKNSIETNEHYDEEHKFDRTAYNYIFNKSTSFIDGNFVQVDHKKLDHILKSFEQTDVHLLELLNYIQKM